MPIIDKLGNVEGILQAINKKSKHEIFNTQDEGLLNILSNIAGAVLKNSLILDEYLIIYKNIINILNLSSLILISSSLKQFIQKSKQYINNHFNSQKSQLFIIYKNKLITYSNELQVYDEFFGIVGSSISKKKIILSNNSIDGVEYNKIIDIESTFPILTVPLKS